MSADDKSEDIISMTLSRRGGDSEQTTSDEQAVLDNIGETNEVGARPHTKHLYRKQGYRKWTEEMPKLSGHDDKPNELEKFALVVRQERDYEETKLIIHSIKIQSPFIRDFLEKLFQGYRGIHTGLEDLTFEPPFYAFFYRWKRFEELQKGMTDSLAILHIQLLRDVIEPEIQAHLKVRQELLSLGLVTYEYLWAIYEPDTEVHSKSGGENHLYLAKSCSYGKHGFTELFYLECEFIDYNGVSFGYVVEKKSILKFEGHRLISELHTVPSAQLPKVDTIQTSLTKRGMAFESLAGMHYKTNSGRYISRGSRSHESRIIVDANLYYQYSHISRPELRSLSDSARILEERKDWRGGKLQQEHMKEHEYRLCSPFVRGYCLTWKSWSTFSVDNISEIEWNEDAFNRLILPDDHKQLLLAFVESQLSQKDHFDDIIAGKGQGIIILLSGEPGVGKTLTAESIAEEMRRPLYAISAGELGLTPSSVEAKLTNVLAMATQWNAVLLLDECDIFLEKRSSSNLERNRLVAIFLRLLEYYKGVLFLTTNRITAFDTAFQSRIHLNIHYPALDLASRRTVWETFVHAKHGPTAYQSDIDDKQLNELAQLKLNGREIKNVVKTARLLANKEGVSLVSRHVDTVLRIKKLKDSDC